MSSERAAPLIPGLSAFYHDSAAALVRGGEILAAAQEERFSRVKHDERFPGRAVEYCLREAGVSAGELDYVVFYEKPLLKLERVLETFRRARRLGFFARVAGVERAHIAS
jgi:carbamoyltransferase